MKRLRVLIAIADLRGKAGAEVFATSLANELRKREDLDVYFLTIYGGHHPYFQPFVESWGDHFLCCERKRGFDLGAAKRFRSFVKEIQPDVIHTHRSCFITYFLAFGTKKQPFHIVHTVHSLPQKDTYHHDDRIKRKLAKKGMLDFVGISSNISSLTKDFYPGCPVRTIFNGFDLFPLTETEKKYDLISVARFSELKNHAMLVRALASLKEKGMNLRLLCCGDGPTLESTKALTKELHLKDDVAFVGAVDDIPARLASSRVFVSSSLYEGNPISVLEAMWAKLPIIAPRVGGIPDVVEQGKTGILYEVGNQEALEQAIEQMWKEDIDALGEAAHESAARFDMKKCAEQYAALYAETTR